MRADMSTADEVDPPAQALNPNPEGLKKNFQAMKGNLVILCYAPTNTLQVNENESPD